MLKWLNKKISRFNKDGKVTKADVLKGRGAMLRKRKKMMGWTC
jgi:hypothetical protein